MKSQESAMLSSKHIFELPACENLFLLLLTYQNYLRQPCKVEKLIYIFKTIYNITPTAITWDYHYPFALHGGKDIYIIINYSVEISLHIEQVCDPRSIIYMVQHSLLSLHFFFYLLLFGCTEQCHFFLSLVNCFLYSQLVFTLLTCTGAIL